MNKLMAILEKLAAKMILSKKDKIIAAEKLASGSPQGQVGNNKTPCKQKNQKQEVPKTPTPPKT